MWQPDDPRHVRVRLVSEDGEAETLWATDLGPAPGVRRGRRVRLGNVPILYSKPTFGDVLVARPDRSGMLTWDGGGIALERIEDAIEEDGGRWSMILEFRLLPGVSDVKAAFDALVRAGEAINIAVEGIHGPREDGPGRAILAVPGDMTIEMVLEVLCGAGLPMKLKLAHPLDDA